MFCVIHYTNITAEQIISRGSFLILYHFLKHMIILISMIWSQPRGGMSSIANGRPQGIYIVPLYRWERMDRHGMSLQSYQHSVSLLSIPPHCTTGNRWTCMGCPFSPTHTLYPYCPSRPTVPLGIDGQTWDVPSVLTSPYIPTVHPVPLYHWEWMDRHGMSLQSYPHSVSRAQYNFLR